MKFKVGDEVRVAAKVGDRAFPAGTIGEIVRISAEAAPMYRVAANGQEWWYAEKKLELVASTGRLSTGHLSAEELQEFRLWLKQWENSLNPAEQPDLYYHLRRTTEGLAALGHFVERENHDEDA